MTDPGRPIVAEGLSSYGHMPRVGTVVLYRDAGEVWPALVLAPDERDDGYVRVMLHVFTTRGDRVEYGVPYDEDARIHRTWGWRDR